MPKEEQHRGEGPAGARATAEVGRHFGALLNKAASAFRDRANTALAPLGVEIRQFIVLTVLTETRPLSQQALGQMLGIDRTTMVALIDDLEKNGYARRERNPQDRRAYAVNLTPKGRATQKRAEKALEELDNALLARFSHAEREQLRQLLLRVLSDAEG